MLNYQYSKKIFDSDAFSGIRKKQKGCAFLLAAPFLAAFVFGVKKGDGQYEHNGFEAQAEKEDSGIKRFFL